MRLLTQLCVLAALVAAALPAAPAEAKTTRGPCLVGTTRPRCDVQRGTAAPSADDGDTIDVHLDGTPRGAYAHVRLTGVQAMELTDYRRKTGECHAHEATRRVDGLLRAGRRRVRLAVQNPASVSRRRPLRSLAVKVRGRYVDVGKTLIAEGQALWLPNPVETHENRLYAAASRRARAAGRGLFDPVYCGGGFQPGIGIQLWVNADPAGADVYHLDAETVTVRNLDPVQGLDLSGWWVRDSGLRRFTFPPGTVVAPGQVISVHVGRGTSTPTDLFWGLRKAVFDNPGTDALKGRGDGAYLFDPEGDVRASMIYPCRGSRCTDPLRGVVGIEAHPRGAEYVKLVNQGAQPVGLLGYRLRYRHRTYALGGDAVLAPGGELRVEIGDPTGRPPGRRWWDLVTPALRNAGGAVRLETFDDIPVGCSAWGDGSCE